MMEAANMGLGGSNPFLHAQAPATTMGMGTQAVATEMAMGMEIRVQVTRLLASHSWWTLD